MARSSAWAMKISSLGTAFAPPYRPRSMNWAIRQVGRRPTLARRSGSDQRDLQPRRKYVEQRRVSMTQDWADRLDLFQQNQLEVASTHLTITLQGLPTIAGQAAAQPPALNPTPLS